MLPRIEFSGDCDTDTMQRIIQRGLHGLNVWVYDVKSDPIAEGSVAYATDEGLRLHPFDQESGEADPLQTESIRWADIGYIEVM